MNRNAFLLVLSCLLPLGGCSGSAAGTGVIGKQSTPIPASGRLLFHGVLRSDINMNNFPPGGTGQIYVYDDVTGQLQSQFAATNGAHFDAKSVPDGHAVRVFFVPNHPENP